MSLKQKRVVAMGGGTGLSTLLRGLKAYVKQPGNGTDCGSQPCEIADLAAIVTVTDDGGSSGRLREDLNILPPGDIRNCMTALSEDEALLSKLFQYRFPGTEEQHDLAGHAFGNLFLAALSDLTGDFAEAVRVGSQILATRGTIYPVTTTSVHLAARMDDGSLVQGETNITRSKRSVVELQMTPPDAQPLPVALEAIAKADLITLGPGSLYTSLISNLLVRGVNDALRATKATRVFICNLMTQANESLGLTASQHLEKVFAHTGGERVFEYALVNTGVISAKALEQYAREGQSPIEADVEAIRAMGVTPVTGNFVWEGSVLRHDYVALAEALMKLELRA